MDNGQHPVHRVPAPWTLKAESYLLFVKLSELPKGVYDRFEGAWEDEALGRFEGGLGAVMIVRYTDTPVGKSLPEVLLRRLLCSWTLCRGSRWSCFGFGVISHVQIVPECASTSFC